MALEGSNDAVERAVLGLCDALEGCVALEAPAMACGPLPLPHIVVRFAASSRSHRRSSSDVDVDVDVDVGTNADPLPLMLRRLEAVGALAAAAGCEALAWRRNPLFWLHALQRCGLADHCGEYFDQRAVSCIRATAAVAAARDSRARRAAEQRAAAAAFVWRHEARGLLALSAQEREAPRFVLDFSYMRLTREVLRALRRLLLARAKARKPAWRFSFVRVMRLLGCVSRSPRVLPVDVSLRLSRCSLQRGAGLLELSDLLHDVAQRLERHRMASSAAARFVPTGAAAVARGTERGRADADATSSEWDWLLFAVAQLDLSATRMEDADFMRLADAVARARGSPLRDLVLSQVFVGGASSPQPVGAFGRLMSECFRPAARGSDDRERPSAPLSIRSLSLDFNALTELHLGSLFSSIHCGGCEGFPVTSGVRELSLQDAFRGFARDRSRPWLWVAFGVFHPHSRSPVARLNLSRNVLQPETVRAVRRLLGACSTPYDAAFTGRKRARSRSGSTAAADAPASMSGQRALLPANVALSSSPGRKRRVGAAATAEASLQQLTTSRECWCPVLSVGSKWTCVLLPGHGRLWVRSSQVLRVAAWPPTEAVAPVGADKRPKRTALSALEMNAMASGEEQVDVRGALLPLIELVGRPLLALRLQSNRLLEADLSTILASCPALKLLDVEACELRGIRPLVAGLAAGSCRIETLNLADNCVPTRDVVDLSRALRGDSEGGAERAPPPLAELHLELNTMERAGLQALTRAMASGNRQLRLLTLDKAADADRALAHRLAQFDGEELGARPLSASHRAALVSLADRIPSIQRCDDSVLTLVAAFAAERLRRQIVWK